MNHSYIPPLSQDQDALSHAMGQFFDNPVTYNPFVAKALGSTKAAILLDHLVEQEAKGDHGAQLNHLAQETGLGLTEVRTALQILENAEVIQLESKFTNGCVYSVSPYFMGDLVARLEERNGIDGHLILDMMNPISINRLHIRTIKDQGGSANAAILLSFLLGIMSNNDRQNKPELTEWFESNDSLWLCMTGMSEKELRNAKKTLITLGYLQRSKSGMPARVLFRLNMKFLADSTWAFATKSNTNNNHVAKSSSTTRSLAFSHHPADLRAS